MWCGYMDWKLFFIIIVVMFFIAVPVQFWDSNEKNDLKRVLKVISTSLLSALVVSPFILGIICLGMWMFSPSETLNGITFSDSYYVQVDAHTTVTDAAIHKNESFLQGIIRESDYPSAKVSAKQTTKMSFNDKTVEITTMTEQQNVNIYNNVEKYNYTLDGDTVIIDKPLFNSKCTLNKERTRLMIWDNHVLKKK